MVGITHWGTSEAKVLCGLALLRGVADFSRAGLAGVLGLAGEPVGVDVAPLGGRTGLPLRRAPAVKTLSRYL